MNNYLTIPELMCWFIFTQLFKKAICFTTGIFLQCPTDSQGPPPHACHTCHITIFTCALQCQHGNLQYQTSTDLPRVPPGDGCPKPAEVA